MLAPVVSTPEREAFLRFVGPVMTTRVSAYVYFDFPKGTPEATVEAWSSALRDMKRDGSFLKIHQKWLPPSPLPGGCAVAAAASTCIAVSAAATSAMVSMCSLQIVGADKNNLLRTVQSPTDGSCTAP